MGLLTNLKKSCTQYYPKDFIPGGDLDNDLIPGATMGPVMNVLINRRELRYQRFMIDWTRKMKNVLILNFN